ncbi:MAG: HAMP domain-containing histidine kinase [Ktedonobacteraceae bacterium]|nr:HAMP domain-containing histidine kinase [Ktedonobacteraceae bacterium]
MAVNLQSLYLLRRSSALIFLLTALLACYLLLKPGNAHTVALTDHFLQVALAGVAFLLTLPLFLPDGGQTRLSSVSPRKETVISKTPQQWVPRLLMLCILSHATGHAIWGYLEVHYVHIFPSWADVACLGSMLPLLLAILLLPSQPLPADKRLQIALDGLMVMVGTITFSWYFILGPTILHGAATLAGKITSAAYPLAVLLQIFCLLLLTLRTKDQTIRPAVLILSVALAFLVLSYSIFAYQQLHNLYVSGEVLDAGWAMSYLFIGLAARAIRLNRRSTPLLAHSPSAFASPEQRADPMLSFPLLWRSLLPYLLIPPTIFLLIWASYMGRNNVLEPGVYIGALTLVGLLVFRQIFVVRGAVAQNNQLRSMQYDLRENNQALRHANAQLEQQARQLEKAYEQLSHLNRLRDQFIANVNHELRTPLTQIDGYLELLSEYQGRIDEETQARFIKRAKDSSQELLLLINTILDALRIDSEIQPPHLEEVALSEVIHQVCEQFAPGVEQASRLRRELPASLVVKADQRYLRQILRNLLSNALKYSPAEAAVTIRAHSVERRGSAAVCISVQDAGPGVPPEEQVSLFQKFVRLKRDLSGPVRGTGLGLYMCKQLVEAMNGEIWVESSGKEGEGSCFCFTILAAPTRQNHHIAETQSPA